MITTIQLDSKVKKKLSSFKVHERESYNAVIKRMCAEYSPKEPEEESLKETIEILSDSNSLKEIAKGLEDYEKGRYMILDDI